MDSLQVTDEAAKAVAVSPSTRVSLDDIQNNIEREYYLNTYDAVQKASLDESSIAMHDSLRVLTLCVIVTRNGFTVIGKAAPADPANFNPGLGRKFAREDAVRQLWPLMGYALRDRLLEQSSSVAA